jgi:surfeit locus 1 family protein
VFVRLGFWQISRLRERRARNAVVEHRMALPLTAIDSVPTGEEHRLAYVDGQPDFEHEFVQSGRSYNGSPGVYIFTPVRVPGRPAAVLVNRGWVYSPDARTVDLGKWRETRTHFTGRTAGYATADAARNTSITGRSLRELNGRTIGTLIPYRVEPPILVSRDSMGDGTPQRLPDPVLDDGPHLSYAIQWFAFATIAVVGAGIVVSRSRREGADSPAQGLL